MGGIHESKIVNKDYLTIMSSVYDQIQRELPARKKLVIDTNELSSSDDPLANKMLNDNQKLTNLRNILLRIISLMPGKKDEEKEQIFKATRLIKEVSHG